MADKKPLVNYSGQLEEIRSGDTISSTIAPGTGGSMPIAAAAGTVDAITADYTPDISLTDLTVVAFVATGKNETKTPTFTPDGLTTRTITKKGGQPLYIGDIPAAGYVCIVEYNSANTRWELLNPAPPSHTKIIQMSRSQYWTGQY